MKKIFIIVTIFLSILSFFAVYDFKKEDYYNIEKSNINNKEVEEKEEKKDILEYEKRKEELFYNGDNEKIITGLTNTGVDIIDFIDGENIAYIDTIHYPFNDYVVERIKDNIKNETTILFDNTESKDYLSGNSLSSGNVVSKYFGASISGEVLLASSYMSKSGYLKYIVMAVTKIDGNNDSIKEAFYQIEKQKKVLSNKF